METGQRWAKIASSDAEDVITTQDQVDSMRRVGVAVSPSGSTSSSTSTAMVIGEEQGLGFEGGEGGGEFDYDLMYRTYLR